MTTRLALDIRLRAERKLGEMLRETGIGKGKKSVKLSDFGLNDQQSSRWQRIADLPEEVCEEGTQ